MTIDAHVTDEQIKEATVEVTVKDDGTGISREQQKQIFHRNAAVEGQGGLSLYTSKLICQQSGGDMRVESELGAGSTFVFWVKVEMIPTWETPQDLVRGKQWNTQSKPDTKALLNRSQMSQDRSIKYKLRTDSPINYSSKKPNEKLKPRRKHSGQTDIRMGASFQHDYAGQEEQRKVCKTASLVDRSIYSS